MTKMYLEGVKYCFVMIFFWFFSILCLCGKLVLQYLTMQRCLPSPDSLHILAPVVSHLPAPPLPTPAIPRTLGASGMGTQRQFGCWRRCWSQGPDLTRSSVHYHNINSKVLMFLPVSATPAHPHTSLSHCIFSDCKHFLFHFAIHDFKML